MTSSGYTLLKLDTDIEPTALEEHARRRTVPLTLVDLTAPEPLSKGTGNLVVDRGITSWAGAPSWRSSDRSRPQ